MYLSVTPARRSLRAAACCMVSLLALSACASQMRAGDRNAFLAQLNAGDYTGASVTAEQAGQIAPDGQTKNIV